MANNLNWTEHINGISKNIYNCLRRLRSFDRALSLEIRARLISAIVIPYLDYCCLLFLDNTAELDSVLQRVLNACIRFIFKLRKFTRITPYLTRLGWLDIRNRRLYFLGSLIYQIKASQITPYLFHKLDMRPPTHNYQLHRNINALNIPFARSESFRKSF